MKKVKLNILTFLMILILFVGQLHAQDFKVIVNKLNNTSEMTKTQVSKLFLKKVKEWSNGKGVLPVNLTSDSPTRKKFSNDIHGRAVSAITAYWQKQIFSGRGVPPPEKKQDKDIITYVQDNLGAIGYVSSSANLTNYQVKVLKVK